MPLQLEIISEHSAIVGDDAVREFSEDGGTIGRSLENDWILPDPDKYISGCHAVIDHRGGIYYLADLSTNGVFVNDEHEPIGKGNPRRLFNGDRLRMGDFEFVVTIDHGESIVMPLEGEQTAVPEPIEIRVPEASFATSMQMLDEEALTGDAAFESAVSSFGPTAAYGTPDPVAPVVQSGLSESELATEASFDEPAPAAPAEVNFTSDDLFDTFLDGLGISRNDLHPSVNPAEVMQNAGEVLKEFVEGTGRLLASRSNLKRSFRLDQTTILPRRNNPLKLSENTLASIKQLLVGQEGEYLGPRDAVREVCRDLLHHQDAFLDAMGSAFTEFSDRFDPDELTASFQNEANSIPLLGFLDRLKYWQMYCDSYAVLTDKGDSRYPQIFAEEFVRAYERQIAEFKRLEAGHANPTAKAVSPPPSSSNDDDAVVTINEKVRRLPASETIIDFSDDDVDDLIDQLDDPASYQA